MINFHFGVF